MIKTPVRFVPKENLIVDSDSRVVCHLFANRGESASIMAEKAGSMVMLLNHICEPYICERCGRKAINKQREEVMV